MAPTFHNRLRPFITLRKGRWLIGGLILWGFLMRMTAQETRGKVTNDIIRVGITSSFYSDVNENDAKAALKAWVATVSMEKGVLMDSGVKTIPSDEIVQALLGETIDVISMSTREYWMARDYVEQEPVFIAEESGGVYQEFLVLAHQDSDIQEARNLRGRSLIVFQNNRTQLGLTWLDVLLLEKGCRSVTNWCEAVTFNKKLFGVVLPVFFRKNDACLVTRKGFETMKELNPQLGKSLKIIATSPKVVTGGLWFRRRYESAHKDKLIAGLMSLHTTPAGQQALTIFQADRMTKQSAACLDVALELLATHRRLCASTNSPIADGANSSPNLIKELKK